MAPSWQLNGHRAMTSIAGGTGCLELKRPEEGFTYRGPQGECLNLFQFGKLQYPPQSIEAYVRKDDLVVNYGGAAVLPFDLQIYWSRPCSDLADRLDCVVAAQTDSLNDHSQLSTRTLGTGCVEILHLRNRQDDALERVGPSTTLTPTESTGCLLVRLGNLSYIELVHPQDFLSLKIDRSHKGSDFSISRPVFDRSLEKGVIVRARVRGILAKPSEDESQFHEAYKAFLADPLPLTT